MLKRYETQKFTYVKKDGSTSSREAFIVSKPSDMYFAIDLSEFNDYEKKVYKEELEEIYAVSMERIKKDIEDIGLSSCYRYFKENGVQE